MDGLFEFFVVQDGPDLPVGVDGPVRGHHLNLTLTHIHPMAGKYVFIECKFASVNKNYLTPP